MNNWLFLLLIRFFRWKVLLLKYPILFYREKIRVFHHFLDDKKRVNQDNKSEKASLNPSNLEFEVLILDVVVVYEHEIGDDNNRELIEKINMHRVSVVERLHLSMVNHYSHVQQVHCYNLKDWLITHEECYV